MRLVLKRERDELNALRYAAGYVPRSLQLLICLWDLLDDEAEDGMADDWLKIIDRGRLTRVNEMIFQVFVTGCFLIWPPYKRC